MAPSSFFPALSQAAKGRSRSSPRRCFRNKGRLERAESHCYFTFQRIVDLHVFVNGEVVRIVQAEQAPEYWIDF